jgi:hypothetical protein
MAEFLADTSASAWSRVVERLLASPQYGERWGRHWLDVARYADTAGDNADYPVPEARLYRDYVIGAFNADMPYDQFVREQLAGDLLAQSGPPERYAEQIIATGFLALSRRYATGPYELWHLTLEDCIETTGRAFLGLTLRCARCHDHKFDPVTQEDYYALYGIFASTQFPWAGAEEFSSKKSPREHFVPLLPPGQAAARLAAHRQRIQRLEDDIRRTETESTLAQRLRELDRELEIPGHPATSATPPKLSVGDRAEEALRRQERDAVQRQLDQELGRRRAEHRHLLLTNLPPELPGAYAVQDGRPADAYLQLRGDVDQHGRIVARNVPRLLAGDGSRAIPPGSSGRLQLAESLVQPGHPLTARVLVNRIWQHHFGKGLVTTPSNFGLRGEPPTHPELLDWLTTRFVESDWSIKTLHRLILHSSTYQLSSTNQEANLARDPANRWYWRSDLRRLDAEAIRDSLLWVGGHLDCRRGGAHPFPLMDRWRWTQHDPFKEIYPSNRRSVYLMTQRFQRHPFLGLFDGPDTNTSTDQRPTSTVPLQALFLMNDPFVTAQAEGLAGRVLESAADACQRIDRALQLAWGRPAQPSDCARAMRYLAAYRRVLQILGIAADQQEKEAWTSFARVLLSANEFVYLD